MEFAIARLINILMEKLNIAVFLICIHILLRKICILIYFKAQSLLKGSECKSNTQCDSKKGLVCIKNSCECINATLYWNTNNQICGNFIIYLLFCFSNFSYLIKPFS